MAISKAEFAIFESVKPSHIRRHKRSWRFENGVKNRHSYKTSEGPRPRMEAPEIGEYDRKVVPTPSWVWQETTARWGVVVECGGTGTFFVTTAEPGSDGRINVDTLGVMPGVVAKIIGVCGYWRYHEDRWPSVGHLVCYREYGHKLYPWCRELAVDDSGTLWYQEIEACRVNFYF